jgi:predicted esterase
MKSKILLSLLLLAACTPAANAQLSISNIRYAAQRVTTRQAAYQQAGGDMNLIKALTAQGDKVASTDPVAAYRAYTHAMVIVYGGNWSPASELTTALDFAINVKIVGPGDLLHAGATFLFDAPEVTDPPYRLELEILKPDGTRETIVEPGIVLGDVRGRHAGETIGLTFDPSKLTAPGEHTIRGTLKDSRGTELYQYYRSFVIVPDFGKRLAALEKSVDMLADQKSLAATTARYVMETARLASQMYLDGALSVLPGYVQTSFRAEFGGTSSELMDYSGELTFAGKLAMDLAEGRNSLEQAKGNLHLAYRSSFDGKLMPFRLYIPASYDRSKKQPMAVLLHGGGGDENTFFRGGSRQLKLAEERGYILAGPNGRGPSSGYAKENGAQQDVLDVMDLVQKNFSIDTARIYLAGHSMGSMGTWTIGLAFRDRFAAIAPIAGSRESPALNEALASPGHKIPIIIFAGGKDPLATAAACKAVAEKVKSLGYPVKYVEFPNDNHWTVVADSIPPMFDWFDEHRR